MKNANFMISPILFKATSRWLSPLTFFWLKFYITCGSMSKLYIKNVDYFRNQSQKAYQLADNGDPKLIESI